MQRVEGQCFFLLLKKSVIPAEAGIQKNRVKNRAKETEMENFLTQTDNVFSEEFRASTRRLPAAARSRAVAHRGRADRQEQRSNRAK